MSDRTTQVYARLVEEARWACEQRDKPYEPSIQHELMEVAEHAMIQARKLGLRGGVRVRD